MQITLEYFMRSQNEQGQFAIVALDKLREEIKAKIDVAYCADRFGSISALDLLDEDYAMHVEKINGCSQYEVSQVIDRSFSYMQLHAEKMLLNFDENNICNLYDVDNFIIGYSSYQKCYSLKVTTDFAVEDDAVEYYKLDLKDLQQLSYVAALAVIDTVKYMTLDDYKFNKSRDYEFVSHSKDKFTHKL